MLELQMGLNRDARRKRLMQKIREACQSGQNRIYMLVPEQSTFVMSREVCRLVGNDLSNGRIEVVGFEQLVTKVYDECGGRKKHLDDGGRLLAMATAVNAVKKDLAMYKNVAGRAEFLRDLLSTYTTMLLHGVGQDKMRAVATDVELPTLKKKLLDLAVIFEAYEATCQGTALDPAAALDNITDILSRGDWLRGTTWFIDGFSDFPRQQLGVLSAIITGAARVVVSLPAAGMDDSRASSALVVKTASKLCAIADAGQIHAEVVRTGDNSDEHPALAVLQNELCDNRPAAARHVEGAEKVIRIFTDPTPYMECQHIAGTIMRAIRKEGKASCRYRDISVVLCDYPRYAPILGAAFRRYGIPAYFSSDKEDIGKKPVMAAIVAALLAATRGMQKEDVLLYLKSGMSNLLETEVDVLESYVRTWNIHGYGWSTEHDWDMHPNGYGFELDDASADRLRDINQYRRKCAQPLLELKRAIAEGATIGEYVKALYNFLEGIGFTEHLQQIVDGFLADGEEQTAMEYGQVSEVLNHAMEQMHAIVGHMETSANEFVKLFRIICSAYKVATIPVSLDQVEVSSIEDARYTCSKVRYIVGAEEGYFPAYASHTALLDSADIKTIRDCDPDIEMPGTSEDAVERSLSDIATVISGAKRMLVFSYASDPGLPSTPSYLVQRTRQMFPEVKPATGGDPAAGGIYDADTMGAEMVGRLLGRMIHRPRCDELALHLCSINNEEMQITADRVMRKAGWALRDLSRESVVGLYGKTIPLSATRADTYAACRYHYFLKYGLRLREPADGQISSPVFGRFAHQVLEQTMREVETKYGGFQNVDKATLEGITKKHIDRYTREKMAGLEDQPERYQYLYKRNCREVLSILRNVCEEFQASDFHSAAFELRVGGEEADLPAIPVSGNEMDGSFTGVADRMDMCTIEGGRTFFRVVDYKTGRSKVFDMSEILLGRSLQMLLYQASLRGKIFGPDGAGAEAAGVLYVPAKETVVATPTKVAEEKVRAEHDKANQRRGIILSDKDAIHAMEHIEGEKARFLPVKLHKDGTVSGDVATAEELGLLDRFALTKLSEMVDNIATGDVRANPVSRGMDRTACQWCPYKAACHKDACGIRFRYQSQVTAEEFWRKIRQKVVPG